MKLLFIDTHSENVNIMIKNGEKMTCVAKSSNHSHSEIAIPSLEEVLKKSNIEVEDLDLIVVVNGPGSFTGVRIGVVIAKTIAFTKKIPIKSISSLEMYGVSADCEYDLVTVEDSKGVYSVRYKNGKFENFGYQKTSEFKKYVSENEFKILKEKKIDLDRIVNYLIDREEENPHLINPIYIKEIDALK